MYRRWGGGSQGYDVQMTSVDSCGTREIEDVRTVKLVYVAGLFRMDGAFFILPAWCGDLVEVVLLAKGSWM